LGGLPSGNVTFAFVDVVGSTRLLRNYGEPFVQLLKRFQHGVAVTATAADGAVVSTADDGAFLAFRSAKAALGLTAQARALIIRKSADLEVLLPVDPSLGFYLERASEKLAQLDANP
jgi:class 3 adenylate cyclase